MRTHAALLAGLAIGLLGPASAQDGTIRLEPKWSAGERVFVTLVTEDWANPQEGMEAVVSQTRTVEYEEKVTEVKDGLPTRTVRKFKRFETQVCLEKKPRKHAFHGKTIEFQRVDGVLECKNESDTSKWAGDTTDLTRGPMQPGADWAWLLPGEPVAVGGSWRIPSGRHLIPIHPALVTGETTCEFASAEDGVALLRFHKGDEQPGGGWTSSFKGEARFSLDAGRVMSATIDVVKTKNDRRLGKITVTQKLTFEMKVLGGEKGAAAATAAPVALQPKWKADERASVRLVTTDCATDSGKAEILNTRTVEYEERATEVKNGVPTRTQRTFRRFEAQRAFEDAPRKHALAGRTVEFQSVDGVLQCKEDTSDLVLDPMRAGADWTWLLPGKAVAAGDTWKIRSGMYLSTVHWALVAGETTCELASVKDGVALLRFRGKERPGGERKFSVTGEAAFSLDAGRVMSASIDLAFAKDELGMTTTQRVAFDLKMLKDAGG